MKIILLLCALFIFIFICFKNRIIESFTSNSSFFPSEIDLQKAQQSEYQAELDRYIKRQSQLEFHRKLKEPVQIRPNIIQEHEHEQKIVSRDAQLKQLHKKMRLDNSVEILTPHNFFD